LLGGGVNELADQHIGQIERQIAELGTLRAELSQLGAKCDSTRPAASCEILKQLSHTEQR
jgi:hypothetical protein